MASSTVVTFSCVTVYCLSVICHLSDGDGKTWTLAIHSNLHTINETEITQKNQEKKKTLLHYLTGNILALSG